MRTHLIAIAALVGGTLTVGAQTPQTQKPQQQQQRPTDTRSTGDTTQRAGQAQNTQTVTLTGCLKPASDVDGSKTTGGTGAATNNRSNTNRGGSGGNFVLTSVKMAQGSTTSGIGLAPSYEISGLADAELQKHVNHQVEITGTLSRGDAQGNRGASAAPGSAAAANADLPDLMGTSLKMVSASCPAAQ
jgi:hypothetical protein